MTQRPTRLPYPGLRAFDREEADFFFGRDGAVNEMIDKLAATGFLAVIGASGTGKSSLVRTGLLDGLEFGLHPAGPFWQFVVFMPGGQPITNLARALVATEAEMEGREAEDDSDDPVGKVATMEGLLRRGPRGVLEWLENSAIDERTHVLLLVDQFEELFRFDTYAAREDAEAFVNLLIESTSKDSRVHVVITMRSEFLGACALIPRLAETLNRGSYLTPRMSRRECEAAIVKPARIVGAKVEDGLVNRLLNDLATFAPWGREANTTQLQDLTRRADQLPVMQHLLNRMWKHAVPGEDSKITLELDEYTKLGGLKGALDAHGDEVLANFQGQDAALVQRMFRALVDGPNSAAATRRPLELRELAREIGTDQDTVRRLVQPFRSDDCNFLRPGGSDPLEPETVIDISHESLIRQWSMLTNWVTDEARAANFWRRLETSQRRNERGEEGLLSGLTLTSLAGWWHEENPSPEWAARYSDDYEKVAAFLAASEAEEQKAAARALRARRRFQFALVGLTIMAVVTAGLLAVSLQQQELATREAEKSAIAQQEMLETQRTAAARQEANQRIFAEVVESVVQSGSESLDGEFGSPTESRLDRITAIERLLKGLGQLGLEEAGLNEAALLEKRISFLIKSLSVKLAGGLISESREQADELAALVLEGGDDSYAWTPPAELVTEAEVVLARRARLLTRYDEAFALLSAAEARLQELGADHEIYPAVMAELLHERGAIHFARREVTEQLAHHDAMEAHVVTVREWYASGAEQDVSPGTTDRARTLRRVYVASIETGIAALVAIEMIDAHTRGMHDPAELLELLEGRVDDIRREVGFTGPSARAADVGLMLARARAMHVFEDSLADALPAATRAVNEAAALFEYDSRNLVYLRQLIHALAVRAEYAILSGRVEQARQDIAGARTLIHMMRRQGADTWTLTEALSAMGLRELAHTIETTGDGRRVAARLLRRHRHASENSGLHPAAHAGPGSAAALALMSTGYMRDANLDAVKELVREGLDLHPLDGLEGDNRYHVLKQRHSIYGRILALGPRDIGAALWFENLEAAAAELEEMLAMAPGVARWSEQMMELQGAAAREHRQQGETGASRAAGRRALELAVQLYTTSGQLADKAGYFENAAGYAHALVRDLPQMTEREETVALLERYVAEVLGTDLLETFGEELAALGSVKRVVVLDLIDAASEARRALPAGAGGGDVAARVETAANTALAVLGQTSGEPSPGGQTRSPTSAGGSGGGGLERESGRVSDDTQHADASTRRSEDRQAAACWAYDPVYPGAWHTLDDLACGRLLAELSSRAAANVLASTRLVRQVELPFYPDARLVELQIEQSGPDGAPVQEVRTYVMLENGAYPVDGSIARVLRTNEEGPLVLPDVAAAAAYLRFFMIYVNGNDGAFQIVETVDDIAWQPDAEVEDIERTRDVLRPLQVWPGTEGAWNARGSVHYGGRIYNTDLSITPTGRVNMTGEEAVAEGLPTRVIRIAERMTGEGVRAVGFAAPEDEEETGELAATGAEFYAQFGLTEEEVIHSFDDEVKAALRDSFQLDGAAGPRLRAEYVALLDDREVLYGKTDAGRLLADVAKILVDEGGDLDVALRFAAEAAERERRSGAIVTILGLAHLARGEAELAAEALARVLEREGLAPDLPNAWIYMGRAVFLLGDIQEAKEFTEYGQDLLDPDAEEAAALTVFAEETLRLVAERTAGD